MKLTTFAVCAFWAAHSFGEQGETLLPAHAGRDAYTPAAAWGGKTCLVAWQSGRNGPGDLRKGLNLIGDIVGCRVDAPGKALDAEPFVICGATDQQEYPRAAFGPASPGGVAGAGGGVFLVVWQDLRNGRDWDIYAARVSSDGKVLDKDGFLVSGGAHNQAKPQVAWDGRVFVIAWQDLRGGRNYEIFAARVSLEGKVLDKDGAKVAAGDIYHCFDAALASAGGGRCFLVSIAEGDPVNGYKVPGAQGWFLLDGKPEERPAYTVAREPGKSRGDSGPDGRCGPMAMAAGGGAYLLAWKNDSSLGRGFGTDRNAALFDGQGVRKQDYAFSAGKGNRDRKRILNPAIAWDGSAFVLAWHEFIREKPEGCPSDVVFMQRVLPGGERQGEPLRLSGSFAQPASSPAVASDGAGASFVAYEKHPASGDVPIAIAVRVVAATTP